MSSKPLNVLVTTIVMSGVFALPVQAGEGGFFKSLAQSTTQRIEQATASTEHRLMRNGDAVARHLERRPEDIKHIDDITKLVATDAVNGVERDARAVVGGVMADSVRSVFGLFRNGRE